MMENLGPKRGKGSYLALVVTLIWCFIAVRLMYTVPQVYEIINGKIFDAKVALSPPPEPSPNIVHLDVDDDAIHRYGRWPWDRSLIARIVQRLSELGAKVIVFDIFFCAPTHDRNADQALFESIKAASNVVSPAVIELAEGGLASSDGLEVSRERDRADALYDRCCPLHGPKMVPLYKVRVMEDEVLPLLPIIKFSKELGFLTGTPDKDGVNRRIPPLATLVDRWVPSLSLAALKAYWNLSCNDITISKVGNLEIRHQGKVIEIPLDSKGMMLVNFGPFYDKINTVLDVLSDKPDPGLPIKFKDKIVILAVTATGTHDRGLTPVATHGPLSRVHSNALSTMLTGSFIVPVAAIPWTVALALTLAILFSIVSQRWPWKLGAAIAIAVSLAAAGVVLLAFRGWSYDIASGEFFVIFVPAAVMSLVTRAVAIERRAVRASRALERYLSPELLKRMVEKRSEIDLSAKRMELTILFVDIQGFTAISEQVQVDYIHKFLNDFFTGMTQAVFDHQGAVNKFLGDGLLAFFGDPIPVENHAEAAVRAAIDMQKAMTKINAKWTRSGLGDFQNGLAIRIGINTGPVIVGDLGSARRVEYTVLGSAVNIASRLESLCPPGGVIMSARTRAMIGNDIACEAPMFVKVKGIHKEIEVCTVQPECIAALACSTGAGERPGSR
jgi:adenylate cyclase